MSNHSYNTLAEKRSVQIAILIFAICSAVWFAFFTPNYKEVIIYCVIAICLREFYAKPYSILEEKQAPQFVKFKKIFRTIGFIAVILPSSLGIMFGDSVSFRYGSPLTVLCSLYVIDEVLALILFYRPEMADEDEINR